MGNVPMSDAFVTYDELEGPDLDTAGWGPARLPLPTGDEHIPLDPNAEVAVGEGGCEWRFRASRCRTTRDGGLPRLRRRRD